MNDQQPNEIERKIQETMDRINASFERSNKRYEKFEKDRQDIYERMNDITKTFVGKVVDFHALSKKGVKDEQR